MKTNPGLVLRRTLLGAASLLPLLAQSSDPWDLSAKQKPAPKVALPTLADAELSQAKAKSKNPDALSGIHRAVPASAANKGRWAKLPAGGHAWSLQLTSPGAKGMRVEFGKVALGDGQLWVGDPANPKEKFGPYTGNGPLQDGTFWSDTILADTVKILYVPRNSAKPAKLPPFQILRISHLLRPPF